MVVIFLINDPISISTKKWNITALDLMTVPQHRKLGPDQKLSSRKIKGIFN